MKETMNLRCRMLLVILLVGAGFSVHAENNLRATENLTPLDEYVAAPDDNFRFELKHTHQGKGWKGHVLHMVSQSWLTPDKVDRTLWEHWLVIMVPDKPAHETALLLIGGGNNGGDMPRGADANLRRIVQETNTVAAQIHQVPNQPLVFADDGRRRSEDAIIAHNWDKFLRTGDPMWITRLPMTKSAVRAMDAIQAFCASEEGGKTKVDNFVVAGASKRGWTTWTTAAVDKRVIACVPIVIDLLNLTPSFLHHYAVYGFWAPAIDDYVEAGIMQWIGSPEWTAMLAINDPYTYRDRLINVPRLILNGAGDQFFLNDSWQFYWDDLKGPKYLRYAPNSGHGMDKADAPGTVTAFYKSIVEGKPLPEYEWSFVDGETVRVVAKTKPSVVKLWQATNPEKRDFRLDVTGPIWTETVLEPQDDGSYVGKVAKPEKGYTAYLVELTFPGPGKDPLILTTPTRITPDVTEHKFEMKTEFPEGFLSKEKAQ